mmetsp:Transcript_30415/g.105068  ORF Transcript_30415/g.105068 Transcript_30415/m.105068 type:complete len:348 (+) Transcript_30415:1285-2328(+)
MKAECVDDRRSRPAGVACRRPLAPVLAQQSREQAADVQAQLAADAGQGLAAIKRQQPRRHGRGGRRRAHAEHVAQVVDGAAEQRLGRRLFRRLLQSCGVGVGHGGNVPAAARRARNRRALRLAAVVVERAHDGGEREARYRRVVGFPRLDGEEVPVQRRRARVRAPERVLCDEGGDVSLAPVHFGVARRAEAFGDERRAIGQGLHVSARVVRHNRIEPRRHVVPLRRVFDLCELRAKVAGVSEELLAQLGVARQLAHRGPRVDQQGAGSHERGRPLRVAGEARRLGEVRRAAAELFDGGRKQGLEHPAVKRPRRLHAVQRCPSDVRIIVRVQRRHVLQQARVLRSRR